MATFLDNDTAAVWKEPDGSRTADGLLTVLYWGDELEVLEQKGDATHIRFGERDGWVRKGLRVRAGGLLEVAFIDVGQGDACLVTTPGKQRILIDGGENKLAARYLAGRFWEQTKANKNVHFDAIVVTHGDADHFDGLSFLVLDAALETRDRKRIRVSASRIFHNGLVKRPGSVAERDALGTPIDHGGRLTVPLVADPRHVTEVNRPFARWNEALSELEKRSPVAVTPLHAQTSGQWSFLKDVEVAVLGPHPITLDDGRLALPLLNHEGGSTPSAARTINGHSITLKLKYKSVSILLTGDLHAESQAHLLGLHRSGHVSLRAEVLKVPHHGSDDVDREFLSTIEPIISVISAGDEDARRDYLHPRANLVGLLGRSNRGAEPVIFVTNLAAFDRYVGPALPAVQVGKDWVAAKNAMKFDARERTAFGIIHVRSDGERLMVIRRGASPQRTEAYAFRVDAAGRVVGAELKRA